MMRLTAKQKIALSEVRKGNKKPDASPRTLKSLEMKGLIRHDILLGWVWTWEGLNKQ
ncbi:hypothetical protein AB7W23_22440 [Providencia rettgeri]